jgi:periplasmic protein CpxP/Spy
MPYLIHPIAVRAPLVRSVATAALLGTTMLAMPITAAWAQVATPQNQVVAPQKQAAAETPQTKGETVEQRITALHTAMKITPEQETKWNGVAQAMRENAAQMDKLVATTRTKPSQSMSAVDDLKTYEKFAQAHVDGLKNLIASFTTLYDTMPDAQKKVADKVFDTSERGADTVAPGKQG